MPVSMDGTVDALDDAADQGRATARDDDVHEAAGGDEVLDRLVRRSGDELDGVPRQAARLQRVLHDLDEGGVRVVRRARAAQQHGVAGLEAQAGGVDRDVGARLVDDPEDPERNAHLADLEPVGQRPAADHLTDRVGKVGDVPERVRDGRDAVRGEGQPVDDAVRRAVVPRPLRRPSRWPRR